MHPNLNVELTVIDREGWKTQIRNSSANAPDVVNWYAATRMKPYVDAGLFMDISDSGMNQKWQRLLLLKVQ